MFSQGGREIDGEKMEEIRQMRRNGMFSGWTKGAEKILDMDEIRKQVMEDLKKELRQELRRDLARHSQERSQYLDRSQDPVFSSEDSERNNHNEPSQNDNQSNRDRRRTAITQNSSHPVSSQNHLRVNNNRNISIEVENVCH